ncbi:MAG: hypothetical protein A2X22_09650 [Bacteroidetes bacterium GWF2_49_14]|nr:MAG: hypothetical protein A2X22_09650 [Bacteroidetes bacterium GWF2_49_14]
MQNIQIILTASSIESGELAGKTAVVIDVLRATSVILTALQNGAKRIRPVQSVQEAIALKSGDNLLGGERNAEKISGFDLGNSPLEYTSARVGGKEIVLTTTNGTLALSRSHQADRVLVAGFLNAAAVAEYLFRSKQPVELICAGTNGEFSLDDFLCAGLIADSLTSEEEMTPNDLVHLAIKTWREAKSDVHQALSACRHYNILKDKGFSEDLDYCLSRDLFRILPVYDPKEGTIRLISC